MIKAKQAIEGRCEKPLVSVIMNCYNGERFLRESIDSVYSQTIDDWEIIFWDNASTDKSVEIAKSYDAKLRCYQSGTLSPLYTARNLALEKCRGQVVTFLDCDDIWLPNKLELQLALYRQGHNVVYGPYRIIDADGVEANGSVISCASGFLTDLILSRNPISIGCVMVESGLLKSEGFDPYYDLLGDFDLWVRLSLKYPFASTDQPLELSRQQHGGNFSQRLKHKWLSERRHFYFKFIKLAGVIKHPGIMRYIVKTEVRGLLDVA